MDTGRVFKYESLIGLPARCPQLEIELDEAGREVEFAHELRVIERTPAPGRSVIVGVAAGAGVGVGLWVATAHPTGATAVVGAVVAGVLATVLAAIDAAVAKRRLTRVADWRRRVGI